MDILGTGFFGKLRGVSVGRELGQSSEQHRKDCDAISGCAGVVWGLYGGDCWLVDGTASPAVNPTRAKNQSPAALLPLRQSYLGWPGAPAACLETGLCTGTEAKHRH